jgi:alkylation response protein AidB-like acyl-CoA dehydrogenase
MDLLPSPEQIEISDSSAAYVSSRLSIERMRQLFETGTTPALDDTAWAGAAELGWFVLGLAEQYGGIGCGLADEALLIREVGRGIAAGPFVSTVLAARVAALAGNQSLADEIGAGRRVGLVVPDADAAVGGDGSIIGSVQLLDATEGLALVVTPGVAAIVELDSLEEVVAVACVDPASNLRRARGNGAAPVVSLASSVEPIEWRAHVLASALLTGITEAMRDTGARHAIDRVQFGKPIGVNQAIKHPCADMAVQAQLAYAQTLFAAIAIDEARPDAEFHALTAHLTAADAANFAAAATIQILGGMGFTHEHDAHLYMKRALLWSHVLGDTPAHLARVLELPEPV